MVILSFRMQEWTSKLRSGRMSNFYEDRSGLPKESGYNEKMIKISTVLYVHQGKRHELA